LRLEQLTQRAHGLAASCEHTIKAVNDPAVQQLAAKNLSEIRRTLSQVSRQIASAPERAVKDLRKTQKRLNKTIAKAESAAKNWSKQQTQARTAIKTVQQTLEAEKQSGNKGGQETLARAEQELANATSLCRQGRYDQVASHCEKAGELIDKAGRESFDESVRKEVVRGLLSTLKDMGFVLETPCLQGDDPASAVVTLSGRMPSGKKATFEVSLDGRMQFDFDGYEGRACAKDLDKIDTTLQQRFSVKLSNPQITWKNPDKIAKGARNLPSSNRNTTGY